jgi:hypothetical protein
MSNGLTCRALLAVTAALFLAGEAGAAALGFTGTLSIRLGSLTPPILATGSGVAQVNGSGPLGHLSQFSIPSLAFGPVSSSVLTFGQSPNIFSVEGFANQSGAFGPGLSGGAPGGGVMGVSGLAKLCIIFPCPFIPIPLPIAATLSGGLGIGGTQTATDSVIGAAVTIQHAPWTLGPTVVTWHQFLSTTATTSAAGFAHGPASGTSNTARPSGTIQLVTISKAWTSARPASPYPEIPLVSTLTLHFVPEPHGLMLVVAGLAALLARRGGRPR